MMHRRQFISLASTAPAFLSHALQAAQPEPERILVVLQLDGGNDGINSVVPHKDPGYAKHRKTLRIPSDRLHKVTDEIGLHPSLSAIATWLDRGRGTIIQGVGYPNPSRSHFESMDIWHSARREKEQRQGLGWLGQAMDQRKQQSGPSSIYVGSGDMPVALRGRRSVASGLTRPEDFLLPQIPIRDVLDSNEKPDDLTGFLSRQMLQACATSERMASIARQQKTNQTYPSGELAQHLNMIADLIRAETGASCFYAKQSGYDTHAQQLRTHSRLLRDLSGALDAFLKDLQSAKLLDQVLILIFSEFGRTVKENGSAGTDHGTAAPVLLLGPKLPRPLIGKAPSLTDLDPKHGDLRSSIDFRQIYTSILDQWLGLPPTAALGGKYKPLRLW